MKQEHIDKFKTIAIQNLERDGNLEPVVMLEGREGKIDVVGFSYKDQRTKDGVHSFISAQLRTGKYKSYLHISEAWMIARKQKKGMDPTTDPEVMKLRASEEPDRQEVISLVYKDETGSGSMLMIPFIKDKNGTDAEGKVKYHITMLYENKVAMDDTNVTNSGGNLWDLWK